MSEMLNKRSTYLDKYAPWPWKHPETCKKSQDTEKDPPYWDLRQEPTLPHEEIPEHYLHTEELV